MVWGSSRWNTIIAGKSLHFILKQESGFEITKFLKYIYWMYFFGENRFKKIFKGDQLSFQDQEKIFFL